MFKNILFVTVLFAFNFSYALPDGNYSCTISPKGSDKSKVGLYFEMKDGEVLCQKMLDETMCADWFIYTNNKAADGSAKFWLDGFYDGGYEDDDQGNWTVFSDFDGCSVNKLILYKDSNFTKGFISAVYNCSADNPKYAGSVFCKKN